MRNRAQRRLALLFTVFPALAFAQVSAEVGVETPEVRIEASSPPPAPQTEAPPPAPAPGYVWVAGHWRW